MKNLFLVTIFAVFCIPSNAQFFTALTERVEKAKERTLLIESGDFECSTDIEALFKKYWTFGKGVEIKSTKEIDALMTPEHAKEYMVLTGDEKMEMKLNSSSAAAVIGIVLYLGENSMIRNELNIDRKFVFKVSFPSCVVHEAEVKFICQHFNNYLNHPISNNQKKTTVPKEATKGIANLTLLIPENSTELNAAELSKYYKYPIKKVSTEKIIDKILAEAAGFAYVNILWSDKRFAWESAIIACKDSEILATAKNDYFKASVNKKKWDKNKQALAICRSKSELKAYEIKQLNKVVQASFDE